jgi:ketosteroid isomerase-like protein
MIGALVAKKAIAQGFDAMNRHDLPKFMAAWHNDGTFIYPGKISQSGTFKGKAAVEGWFRSFFIQFPTIRFQIQNICVKNIFDLRGTNVLTAHWDVNLKNRHGIEVNNSGVTVITIKGGKVLVAKDFLFHLGENFKLAWGSA